MGTELSLMGDAHKEEAIIIPCHTHLAAGDGVLMRVMGGRILTGTSAKAFWGRDVSVEICLVHKDLGEGFEKSPYVARYGDACLSFQILWSLRQEYQKFKASLDSLDKSQCVLKSRTLECLNKS